ncbi:MAG: VCBS repeat-containing protein [Planctomycetales bacterium]|nr:VCBS repeat-containing protein [Planctomycetales bacterium]
MFRFVRIDFQIIAFTFVCCAIGVAAVGVGAEPSSQNSNTAATVRGFDNTRFNRPFQEDLDRMDPSADGWSTESFSDAAMAQLKKIGAQIASPDSDFDWSTLRTANCQCTPLQPEAVAENFSVGGIAVYRSGRHSADAQEGSNTLEEVVSTYGQKFAGQHPHVHFKIFRVESIESGRSWRTLVYFQLGATGVAHATQVTATWDCEWQPQPGSAPRLSSLRVSEYEGVASARLRLIDATEAVLGKANEFVPQFSRGLDYWVGTLDRRLGLDIVGIHGVAIGDVDNDGLDDIYFCEPGGLPNRLYLHKSDGTAREVSAVAGVDYLEATRSALFLDLDNDGDQDLVAGSDRFVIFCENDGFGRFHQRAAFKTPAAIVSMAAADYDLDGDLDVYACGYFTKEDAAESSIGLGNPIPFHDANNGAKNSFFRCDGDWTFVEATAAVGLDQDNRRFSLAASWEDYDLDGDPDLYVANDYGRNCLYRNDNGHFVNVAAEAGVEDISAGMSISWGDYNRDGLPDIYVSNMFSSAGNRISYQRQFKEGATEETIKDYQKFAHGNTLFANSGDGTFRDVTDESGVTLGRWAWGSDFIDINNDGWEDLFVTNGMLTRDDPNDL